jgi:macro domain-containing protein
MLVFETGADRPRWIVNFPTKRHWRAKSRLAGIEAGMEALAAEIRAREIRSIAIPPLGSGLGGLDWRQVRPVIEHALNDVPEVRAIVYEPGGRPEKTFASPAPNMTPGPAALIGLIRRYLAAMMDTSISLLEIHKLMYFLQDAGEPLRLQYVKAPYGPYAQNLRHVLMRVNGHFISGYSSEGDVPTEQVELLPGAIEQADAFPVDHPATNQRFDRVDKLVEGFETPFGLELLATTHWVASREHARTNEEITAAFYNWGPGKSQFKPEQIAIAAERLRDHGWLGEDEPLPAGDSA